METKDLVAAYADLLAAAESITDNSPIADADRAQADWLLAHIALKAVRAVYWQLDYMLLFGGFDTPRDLGPYYTRQGFTVLRPGQTIDVGTLLAGVPIQLGSGPGETFFYRWRGPVTT